MMGVWTALLALTAPPVFAAAGPATGSQATPAQSGAAAAARASCAVVTLGDDVAGADASGLVAVLHAAVTSTGTCQLQPVAATRAEMESARALGLVCAIEDVECLRKLAVLLGVDRVLAVRASPDADRASFTLAYVDEVSGERLGARQFQAPRTGPQRDQRVQRAVGMLLQPDRWLGSLRIDVTPPGAQVLIDDVVVGTSPLASAIDQLSVGPHRVEARLEGHQPVDSMVEIEAGREIQFAVRLAPRAEPRVEPEAIARASAPVPGTDEADPARSEAAPDPRATRGWGETAGWVIVASGAGLSAMGGVTALVLNQLLVDPSGVGVATEREAMWLSGRVALGVSLTGVLVGALGLGTALGLLDIDAALSTEAP